MEKRQDKRLDIQERKTFHFTKMEIWELSTPFRLKVTHSLASRKGSKSIVVALTTNNGHTGCGEILAREYLTGENNEIVWKDLKKRWWPQISSLRLSRKDPKEKLYPMYLEADKERKNASYAGIDLAVYDAWGKETGQSLEEVFASGKQNTHSEEETFPLLHFKKKKLQLMCKLGKLLGFKHFKLKVGIQGQDDILRIKTARKVLGSNYSLRIDANMAWTTEYCLKMEKFLVEQEVYCVEQPVVAHDMDGMAKIEKETKLRVMADESLCTLDDAKKLLAKKAASIWNIRIGKVGGFTGFFTLRDLALEHGVEFSCGSLVGEGGALRSALLCCLPSSPAKYVEYSYPLLFKEECLVEEERKGAVWRKKFPLSYTLWKYILEKRVLSKGLVQFFLRMGDRFRRKAKKKGLGVFLDREGMKKFIVRQEKFLLPKPKKTDFKIQVLALKENSKKSSFL